MVGADGCWIVWTGADTSCVDGDKGVANCVVTVALVSLGDPDSDGGLRAIKPEVAESWRLACTKSIICHHWLSLPRLKALIGLP